MEEAIKAYQTNDFSVLNQELLQKVEDIQLSTGSQFAIRESLLLFLIVCQKHFKLVAKQIARENAQVLSRGLVHFPFLNVKVGQFSMWVDEQLRCQTNDLDSWPDRAITFCAFVEKWCLSQQ